MYPLGRMSELRNRSPGFWAKAARDTSTRITTAVTEIELMTRALLGHSSGTGSASCSKPSLSCHRCLLDGSVRSSALQVHSVTGKTRASSLDSIGTRRQEIALDCRNFPGFLLER